MSNRKWLGKIGKHYVDRLPEVAVEVGGDKFTRRELVVMAETVNFYAAQSLNDAIKHFKPKNVREMSRRVDQHMLRQRANIGDTAIFVWCCILDASGLNVEDWLGYDFTDRNQRRKKRMRNKKKKR